jgi:hypothetical protein
VALEEAEAVVEDVVALEAEVAVEDVEEEEAVEEVVEEEEVEIKLPLFHIDILEYLSPEES